MKHPEEHPEEGTIHAWLDDALEPDEAHALEAHVSTCADCSAMVAEARGLIAAASRVVSQLDGVPAQVVPAIARTTSARVSARTPAGSRSWWRFSGLAAAAVFLMVSATWVSMRAPTTALVRAPMASSAARSPREADAVVEQPRAVASASGALPKASAPVPALAQRDERRASQAKASEAKSSNAETEFARKSEPAPERLLGLSRSRSEELQQIVVTSAAEASAKVAAPVSPSAPPPSVSSATLIASSTIAGCYSLSPATMIAGGSAAGMVALPPAGGGAASARMARPQAAFAASPASASGPQLRLTDSLSSVAVDSRSADAVARDASAREQATVAYIGYASGLIPRTSVMSDAPTANSQARNAPARNAPASNTLVRWSALGEDLLRVQMLDGASVLVRVAPDGLRSSTTLPQADFTARRAACP